MGRWCNGNIVVSNSAASSSILLRLNLLFGLLTCLAPLPETSSMAQHCGLRVVTTHTTVHYNNGALVLWQHRGFQLRG